MENRYKEMSVDQLCELFKQLGDRATVVLTKVVLERTHYEEYATAGNERIQFVERGRPPEMTVEMKILNFTDSSGFEDQSEDKQLGRYMRQLTEGE